MYYGIQDLRENFLGLRSNSDLLRKDEFWALKDISFDLRRGEALGLVGRNGSGKTTLLRLLTGIFPPDHGEIMIRGRVGALIAVGAGFHPHMTGRENIYLNGAILGMNREEIDVKFSDIIDFADIKDFLDAPVSTYSSGMRVRLGFSIATSIKPDVLLIDEILAVGDAKFRNKCYHRIEKVCEKSAVIFVSHGMDILSRICRLSMVLKLGHVSFFGDVADGIAKYLNDKSDDGNEEESFENTLLPIESAMLNWSKLKISYEDTIELVINFNVLETLENCLFRVVFYDVTGAVVSEWNSRRVGRTIDLKKGSNSLRIHLGPIYLRHGKYPLGIVLNNSSGIGEIYRSYKKFVVEVTDVSQGSCPYQLPNRD